MNITAYTQTSSSIFSTLNTTSAYGLGRTNGFVQGGGSGSQGYLSEAVGKSTEAFAADIMSRVGETETDEDGEGASEHLQDALAGAMDHIRENYGDEAADAAMGVVYNNLGSGEVTEDSLGAGLLNAVKFIDNNFGFAAGDNVIGFFNGDLNESLNDYFQNGFNEQFIAVNGAEGSYNSLTNAVSSAMASLTENYGEEAAQSVTDIIINNLEQGGFNRDSLSKGLAEAENWLNNALGEEEGALAATGLQSDFGRALSLLQPDGQYAAGSLVDLTV